MHAHYTVTRTRTASEVTRSEEQNSPFYPFFLTLAAGDIQTCHSPGQSVERLALDEDHHLSVQFRSAMARKVFFLPRLLALARG
jgi:hypothetical protein